MAGVKGRSGGARPNTGGRRPGAGRKPKPAVLIEAAPIETDPPVEPETPGPFVAQGGGDPLALLLDIAFGRIEANANQVRAAVAAVQYTHTKRGDGGKKEEAAEKAKKASAGRFAARSAPKLIVSN